MLNRNDMRKAPLSSDEVGEQPWLRALAAQMLYGFLIGVALAIALVMKYTASIEHLLSSGHMIVASLLLASGVGVLFAVGALATFMLGSKD